MLLSWRPRYRPVIALISGGRVIKVANNIHVPVMVFIKEGAGGYSGIQHTRVAERTSSENP